MNISANGIKLIQAFEGLGGHVPDTNYYRPYTDSAGIWTIGWGHAFFNGPLGVTDRAKADDMVRDKWGEQAVTFGITKETADAQLMLDLKAFEGAVTKSARDPVQFQFDAMVSFAFNVGVGAFNTSTMLKYHNAGAPATKTIIPRLLAINSKAKGAFADIPGAFTAWSYVKGVWTLGLFRRRLAEALVYNGADLDTALSVASSYHV